jgi:outer membrane biosynthesis protein TonB
MLEQLSESPQDRWRGRPVAAVLLRVLIVAIPLGVGYLVTVAALRLLRGPLAETRWWLLLIAAISVGACLGVERATRRLLPLAALLKLSMLFPDRAPSRFKVARQSMSMRTVKAEMASSRTDTAAAAAEAALTLITALTAHDRRTRGHCERVRLFAELLGEELRLPTQSRDRLRWAALLHDIGKLKVAPEILNKPAKLKPAEWDLVAQHPMVGEELLGPLVEWLGEWGTAVRQHHEKFDGTGYPDGLAGDGIGRAARIIAVVDSFEVMTAHRAYKKPMATVAARAELTRCAGTQFDPVYVRAFLAISLPRLLWAMGPGSLLMNLPMLRTLAQTTNNGVLAGTQATALAASAATVIGGVAIASGHSHTPAPAQSQLILVGASAAAPPTGRPNHPPAPQHIPRPTPTPADLPSPPATSGTNSLDTSPASPAQTGTVTPSDTAPVPAAAPATTSAAVAPPIAPQTQTPAAAPTSAAPTTTTTGNGNGKGNSGNGNGNGGPNGKKTKS